MLSQSSLWNVNLSLKRVLFHHLHSRPSPQQTNQPTCSCHHNNPGSTPTLGPSSNLSHDKSYLILSLFTCAILFFVLSFSAPFHHVATRLDPTPGLLFILAADPLWWPFVWVLLIQEHVDPAAAAGLQGSLHGPAGHHQGEPARRGHLHLPGKKIRSTATQHSPWYMVMPCDGGDFWEDQRLFWEGKKSVLAWKQTKCLHLEKNGVRPFYFYNFTFLRIIWFG